MSTPQVDIAVGSRFHLFDLARELHDQGALGTLYTGYPRMIVARFGIPPEKVKSLVAYEIANRVLNRWMPHGVTFDRIQAWLHRQFARWVGRNLQRGSDVFVGLSSMSLETLSRARQLGMVTVVERGSSHVDWPVDMLRREEARMHIPVNLPSDLNRARERAEYALADYIAVPGAYARDSFVACGVEARKILVNPYGVDLQRFVGGAAGTDKKPDPFLTVIHVGRIGVRKGVHHLIRAIDLVPQARLLLVGGLDPGMGKIVAHPRVTLLGTVPQAELPKYYAKADVFCLLSLDEGFGMVLLQAGAMGLPIVASTATGAVDAYRQGESALLVEPGDPEKVADYLQTLIDDPALRARLGAAARRAVEQGFGWRDYGTRAIAHYTKIMEDQRANPVNT
jgi:glycosyltransferase involved in cell wall biosynthesis